MRFSPTPWLIAAVAFIVLGFSRGIHSSFGVFNVALLDTFGWSRGATAGIFAVVLTMDALLSPVVGFLLDRFGVQKITVAGCLALVGGLFFSSRVTELWQLYVCFGLVLAAGFTFTGMVPHVFLISEWFSSSRASAIGVVYAGTGLGIMLLAPLSEWLISSYGWARAFEAYAAVVLIALLPMVWFFYQQGPHGARHRDHSGRGRRRKAMDGEAGAQKSAILDALYRARRRRLWDHGHRHAPGCPCRRRRLQPIIGGDDFRFRRCHQQLRPGGVRLHRRSFVEASGLYC